MTCCMLIYIFERTLHCRGGGSQINRPNAPVGLIKTIEAHGRFSFLKSASR